MTPKEKAEELVDKYDPMFTNSVRLSIAKKFALIAIDDILKVIPYSIPPKWEVPEMGADYWEEVKKEINNL